MKRVMIDFHKNFYFCFAENSRMHRVQLKNQAVDWSIIRLNLFEFHG